MVPEERIIEIGLKKLRGYILKLREAASNDAGAAIETETVQQTFRRLIVLATNLANYAIGRWKLPAPEDPANLFAILAAQGLIPTALAARLRDVAVLRKTLAHGYSDLRSEDVRAWIPARLADFEEYAEHLTRTLKLAERTGGVAMSREK